MDQKIDVFSNHYVHIVIKYCGVQKSETTSEKAFNSNPLFYNLLHIVSLLIILSAEILSLMIMVSSMIWDAPKNLCFNGSQNMWWPVQWSHMINVTKISHLERVQNLLNFLLLFDVFVYIFFLKILKHFRFFFTFSMWFHSVGLNRNI